MTVAGIVCSPTRQGVERLAERHDRMSRIAISALYAELGVWITPVICLDQRRGHPFRAEGVWIVPREQLLGWLRGQRNEPVRFERLTRFADSLPGAD